MEAMLCNDYMTILSAVLACSKGIQGITFRDSLAATVARKLSMLTVSCLWGSTLDFLSEFTSIAFSMSGYDCKVAEV